MRGGVGVTVAFALLEGRDSDSASREVMILHESLLFFGAKNKKKKKKKKNSPNISDPSLFPRRVARRLVESWIYGLI